uniref:Uncharacterized protein n=1 Tax=Acrobeloides nanus TaxID=290746 RepID=A0A914E9F7_9BILA
MILRIVWLFLALNLWGFCECKVISCGGFIKSFAKIDLTKIQVKLLTTEGNLKYETECNPNNGYFMIPIYNKGVYVFKIFAPHGWIFAPESIRIDVNGIDDVCTKGEDINFSLHGFTVSGKVKSGEEVGPSQFHLGLYSSNGTLVSETVTSAGGDYEFKAPPGEYIVSTVRSEECVERGSVPVQVIDTPVTVKEDIKISGHSVSITVNKEDGSAFANIDVSLTSDVQLQFNELPQHYTRPSITQKDGQWVYTIKTNSDGTTQICLPPGKYSAQPSYKKESVQFSFSPSQAPIVMKSEAQKISFRVSGFSTHGKVNVNKLPISGATILVNNSPRTESNEQGSYQLDEIKEGTYAITAKKKHYEFDTVTVELSSSNPVIPDITAKKYSAFYFF